MLPSEILEVINTSCRICMTQAINMIPLFDAEQEQIVMKVLYCTGIEFSSDDGLPSNICHSCHMDLCVAHRFKLTCIEANDAFHKLISESNMKSEEALNSDVINVQCFDVDNTMTCEGGNAHFQSESKIIVNRKKRVSALKNKSTGRYECDRCRKTFASSSGVHFHIRTQHLRTFPHPCPRCARRFADTHKLGKHLLSHEKGTVLRVKTPDPPDEKPSITRDQFNNENHVLLGLMSEDNSAKERPIRRKLYCSICDIKFSSRMESEKHRRKVHKGPPRVCEICGAILANASSYASHVRSHRPPRYYCAHCAYRACQRADLVTHLRIHSDTRRFQCEQCAKSFTTSSNLRSHIRRHSTARPYACPKCPNTYKDSSIYKRHLATHYSIKRFECGECGARFSRTKYLRHHLITTHNLTLLRMRGGRQKQNIVLGEDDPS